MIFVVGFQVIRYHLS